jgi:mediator of RNA polymerase II transcription subunit 31
MTSNGSYLVPILNDRFLIELEFVQNLCNIRYLGYLANNKYFDDMHFMNFLKYLRYWKNDGYIQHLMFPQCLKFLDELIDNEAFRKELSVPQFIEYCHQQQGLCWLHGFELSKM